MNISEDKKILFARLDDLCRSAEQGIPVSSCFLSPRELYFGAQYLRTHGMTGRFLEWGGYGSAERKKIIVLPEYMEGVSFEGLSDYGVDCGVAALLVLCSGFVKVTHRDLLGSVLGLGIERDVIGDIVLSEGEKIQATVICDAAIAEYIEANLVKVGRDTVKVKKAELSAEFVPERKFVHLSGTVASARLDCIVAAVCSLSREKAREAVVAGLVELDYEPEERPDRTVSSPAVLAVRGYGKFKINAVSDVTRKGRIRLDADKYV